MAYSYVLVVDDDPAIRGLVADALRSEGYAVDLAAHGREALDALRARRPATIVLDLMMPVMDGFSFIEACQKEQLCTDVPIVVISALQGAVSEEEAVSRGPVRLHLGDAGRHQPQPVRADPRVHRQAVRPG